MVGPSSITQVIKGKHYNRSMYVHKVLFEALEELRFASFLRFLDPDERSSVREMIQSFRQGVDDGSYVKVLQSHGFEVIAQRYNVFVTQCRQQSLTFDYWSSYLEMVGKYCKIKLSNMNKATSKIIEHVIKVFCHCTVIQVFMSLHYCQSIHVIALSLLLGTLLAFIRATRTSDWDLHIETIYQMMPWYFAYDRQNYSRYMTAYLLEMTSLDETHPGSF